MKALVARMFCILALGTPPLLHSQQVVINEIMYHPQSENPLDEFIELYNQGTNAVNLSGWRFAGGVSFTFTNGTSLPAGGYLVVVPDLAAFQVQHPLVNNVVGGWAGQLSNTGESIELQNAQGDTVNVVHYADAGDWAVRTRLPDPLRNLPSWEWVTSHDGGGDSIELINPALDNNAGANWAPSNPTGGTPGGRNSVRQSNIAPLILNTTHFPAVPKSTDSITITARLVDEQTNGLSATLYFRNASSTPAPGFTGTTMFDDGAHGDGVAGDGVYGVVLSARANGTILEYYVQASDGVNVRTWPAPAVDGVPMQAANALLQVDDSVYAGPQPILRLVLTETERATLDANSANSDAQMNATLISIDGADTKIRHNCSIRVRGAGSRGRPTKNYRVDIPSDRAWNGLTAINLNSQYIHVQLVGSVVAQKSGLVAANARAVQVRLNGVNRARSGVPQGGNGDGSGFGSYALVEPINNEWAGIHFPTDPNGNVYRASSPNHQADLSYQGTSPATYSGRGYSKTSNASENDWTDLINLTDVLNNTPDLNYTAAVSQRLNVREWMTYFAVFSLMEYSETSLGSGEGDDYALYRGLIDTRFKVVGHDFDTIFGEGDTTGNTNESIFVAADATDQPAIDKFLKWPDFSPIYFEELHRLATGTFSAGQLNPIFDQFLTGLAPDNIIAGMKTFAANRAARVLAQIPMTLRITNALPVVSGYPSASTPAASLTGAANAIRTRSVRVNGQLATWVAWRGTWSISGIALNPGINRVVVQSLDAAGAEIERGYSDIWYDDLSTQSVSGTLSANTTWTAAGGPYYVTATLTVPGGVTLTIEPGTTVYFAANAGLTVTGTGRLLAEGTETQRIRFTRVPGAAGNWANLYFNGTSLESRVRFADLEFTGGTSQSLRANNAIVYFERLGFTNTAVQHCTFDNSSFVVRGCEFPSLAGRELLHGVGLPVTGYGIIESNVFGTTTGLNDIIDFTGGQRPGAILQILGNVFTGASDDMLDLDGTDCLIEGNLFLHAHQATPGGDTSSAISAGQDSGNTAEITIVRNIFYDCDHAALVKEGNFYTLVNNTIVGTTVAAVNFNEPARNLVPGAGALLDGNIIWQTPLLFENYTSATMNVTVTRSILPTNFPGIGNAVIDPLLTITNPGSITAANIRDAFRLLPGSPAIGTGPNGIDMGAVVPLGASISGAPASPTSLTAATLVIGGPAIVSYQYRVNNGSWSAETPVSSPVVLSSLANGSYTVEVRGRNDAGVQQSDVASRTWTVNTALSRIQINEVLARNDSAFAHAAGFPDAVELYNSGGVAVNLAGWGFTDDPQQPFKYRFPPGTSLGAGQFLVLYADNGTNIAETHLGFSIDQSGETLQLVNAATNVIDSITFGTQLADLSIGRDPNGAWRLTQPTLGAANIPHLSGDPHALKINEWLASGRTLFPQDFLEIYNPNTSPVDLGGLFLSDEPLGWPGRHRIPALTFVAAGGHYAFLADGNAGEGPSHLSFHLSPDRGAIGLADVSTNIIDCVFYGPQTTDSSEGRRPDGASLISVFGASTGTQPTPGAANPGFNGGITVSNFTAALMPMVTSWRYNRSGTDLGTTWRGSAFNDSSWSSGLALLGVENCNCLPFPLNTVFPNYNNSQITYYFRTRFVAGANLAGATITASTVLDDGAVIYLNGVELRRIRMPSGTIAFQTQANATVSDASLESFTFSGASLVAGTNVLAVEVHQIANPTSSDIVWGMALDQNISITNSTPARVLINEVLANNVSIPNPSNTADYIELYNPSASATSLAGMSLSDDIGFPTRWTFPAGVTLPAGGYLIVRFDDTAPASTNAASLLNTGFGLAASGDQVYLFDTPSRGGALLDSIVFGIQAADLSIGRVPSGTGGWTLTLPTPGGVNIAASLGNPTNLRFNEWLANPSGNGDDFFELYNPDAQPVALGGLYLTDDLLNRTKHRIADLSFVGADADGFVKFVADNHPTAGADHVNFGLNQDGESLGLFTAGGTTIDSRTFGAQESGVSEGRFPDGSATIVRFRGTSTPGHSNLLPLQGVVINEVLTHSELPFEDAIELHNPTGVPVDISGWYLSDRASDPKRFRIPNGTVLQPGGFVVFYENQFNPDYSGRPPYFALDSLHGDQVYLFTADGAGNLTGYRTGVDFGSAANAVSFGRFETSLGTDFTALGARTFGADNPATVEQFRTGAGLTNAYPLVGPVVISEIMYHPPDVGTNDNILDEFIELRNILGVALPLYDTNAPANTWRLRDAVDFDFPPGVTLAADSWLLVVGFDPVLEPATLAAFRARYGVSNSVPVYGPWQGRLANDTENVELYRPDAPEPPTAPEAGFVPYILVDRVKYSDAVPWPSLADGATNGVGYSLQRLAAFSYGNDPVNWIAGTPTPGAETGSAAIARPFNPGITPPHVVFVGANDTLTVVVGGAPPLSYQWRMNGIVLAGATNASLVLSNIQPTNAGTYSVLIANPAGATYASTYVEVSSPPVILVQPQSQGAIAGSAVVLNVAATGSLPLYYQWRRDGSEIPGATNAALVLSNVQTNDVGGYSVVITNSIGSITSQVAVVSISMLPIIVTQPVGTNVLAGTSVAFSVAALGTPPLRYQWRFNNLNISGATNPTYFISSAQTVNAGNYRVFITNNVGSVLSSNALLEVTLPALVSVTASDAIASEPGTDTGRFVVQRSGSTASSLLVNLNIGGSATPGVDYSPLPSSVLIAPGSSTATLIVTPIDDSLIEGSETVAVSIAPGSGYAAGVPNAASVTIFDNDNLPPSVAITNPVNGAILTAPVNVLVGVSATDIGGSVSRVQLIQDETNVLGDFTTPPYVVVWSNPPPATYTLKAIATDDLGTSAESAPVTFIVNQSPSVSLTNPVNGAVYLAPATILLAADASDADGSVTNVELYSGTNLLATFTAPPYRVTLTNLGVGDYSFSARATDQRGALVVSGQSNVRVTIPSPGFSDEFASRNLLTGFTNFVTGNSANYTKEPGEPRHANRAGDHSGWLTWTAPASGTCVIDTFGSSFDTVLAVYTNNPPSTQAITNLVAVTFNDDADTRTVLSRVTFAAVAGVNYQIAVDAYGAGLGGSIILHLNLPNPAPQITANPQSQVVDQGANVVLAVGVLGSAPLVYQWRLNDVDVPGVSQSSVVFTAVQPASEGVYTVVITNAYGSVTSAPASLVVRAAPTITQAPQAVVVDVGGTANFAVGATGFAPLSYQWRFNNMPIAGATSATLVRSDVQYTNGGAYSVTILNSVGSASSTPVDLVVRPRILFGRLTNGAFRVTYNGTPGRAYALERSGNLTNWNAIATNTSPAVQGQVIDLSATGAVLRAYRLRVTP